MLIIISAIISAVATVVIAWFAYETNRLQDKTQTQLSDLYKAIVIATLLSGNSDASQLPTSIAKFKEYYNGSTSIFTR